jgi:hypothetical protein
VTVSGLAPLLSSDHFITRTDIIQGSQAKRIIISLPQPSMMITPDSTKDIFRGTNDESCVELLELS